MMIPYGKQDINAEDIEAVLNVLQSEFLTQGPQIPHFENSIKKAVKAQYAIAVNSATSALHIACLALGVGKGDVVWTTPISFVASANCALYCGASIDFVDIDADTYNLSVFHLQKKLQHARLNHLSLPKVVIPVHLCGQSCAMQEIYQLSQEYGFSIIEDASHSIGGRYLDRSIGGCQYSDISIFSFHPVKIVTTAEGGVATTNNASLAQKMTLLRSHGITRDPLLMSTTKEGDCYYEQVCLGFNYRMTEMQAALGVSQMRRLASFVTLRNKLAKRYDHALQDLPVQLPQQMQGTYSSRHLYIIRLQLDKIQITQKEVFSLLREKGIGVNLHYIPIHLQPYYQRLGFLSGQFPHAESYYKNALSLPLYHGMTKAQQDVVIVTLKEVLLS